MNDLPPTPPLPRPGDGDIPAAVSRVDELLSAMVDGDLTPAELLELEETAVATNTTVQEMAEPFYEGQSLTAESVLDLRPPSALRHQQLRNALAQLDQPEVASLAAARATLEKKQHHQRRRMQRLSSVAAALVVVAGIGILGSQLGGSGNDAASSDEEGATITLSRDLSDEFAGSAAADDAASSDGDITEMSEMAPLDSSLAASNDASRYQLQDAPTGVLPSQLGNEAIESAIEFQTFDVFAARGGEDPAAASEDTSNGGTDGSGEAESARCTDTAIALQDNNEIPEITGLALVIVDDQIYEVYQLADDNFAVFNQTTCNRVD